MMIIYFRNKSIVAKLITVFKVRNHFAFDFVKYPS